MNRLGSKGKQVVAEVASRTIEDAIKSAAAFEGGTIKEFRKWIFVIARRRIVDYHRKGRVEEVPLEVDYGEGTEERQLPHDEESTPLEAVELASVWSQAYGELRQDSHKMVIRLRKFQGLSHREIADEVKSHFGGYRQRPHDRAECQQDQQPVRQEAGRAAG